MNPASRVGWTVGIVTLTMGATAWWLAQERSGLAVSKIELRDRQGAVQQALAKAGERAARAATEVARVKVAFSDLSAMAPARKEVQSPAVKPADARKRSESTERYLVQLRARLGPRYAPLFRTLGLDTQRQQAFIENVMRRDEQYQDLNEAAMAQRYNTSDGALAQLRQGIVSEYEGAQRTLLGDNGYGELVEFDRTSSLRGLVGNLAGLAAVDGAPLSSAQTQALLAAMAGASSSYQKGESAQVHTVDWDQFRAQLPKILDRQQVELLLANEPQGGAGGLHHAEWNRELLRATAAEKDRKAEPATNGGTTPRGGG